MLCPELYFIFEELSKTAKLKAPTKVHQSLCQRSPELMSMVEKRKELPLPELEISDRRGVKINSCACVHVHIYAHAI